MARLNAFVVSFILLCPRRNGLKEAHTNEHSSGLPYSAELLEPRGPLSLLKLRAKLLRRFLLAARLADRAPRWFGAAGRLLQQSRLRSASSDITTRSGVSMRPNRGVRAAKSPVGAAWFAPNVSSPCPGGSRL
jgi:hypothetical protein